MTSAEENGVAENADAPDDACPPPPALKKDLTFGTIEVERFASAAPAAAPGPKATSSGASSSPAAPQAAPQAPSSSPPGGGGGEGEEHPPQQHRSAEDYGICTTESALRAARFAARAAHRMSSNSSILDRTKEVAVPRFAQSELRLGERLGRGGFSNVYEVTSISLLTDADDLDDGEGGGNDDSSESNGGRRRARGRVPTFLGAEMEAASTSARAASSIKSDEERVENARHQAEARDFVRMHCIRTRSTRNLFDSAAAGDDGKEGNDEGNGGGRNLPGSSVHNGDARFAVKFLRRDVMADKRRYKIGAADLVVEAKFLSCLEHPNIVRMRGVTSEGVRAFATGIEGAYFLLMDRLYDTLEVRIQKWRKESKRFRGRIKGALRDKGGAKRRELLIRRLCVAFDVVGALRYLHERNIIYRDLKPENLAFDVRGDIRLFDFGLAKELQESERVGGVQGDTYRMSGNTGSLRYMAPEVALGLPYNLTADSYSFGTMLWEMLTLNKPYDGFSRLMHSEMVVEGEIRPSIPTSWPVPLQNLVRRSWGVDIDDRPSMEHTYKILRKLIIDLRDGDDSGLSHSRRRSTFILGQNKNRGQQQQQQQQQRKKTPRASMVGLDAREGHHRRSDPNSEAARQLDSVNVGRNELRAADSEFERVEGSGELTQNAIDSLGLQSMAEN